MPNGMRLGMEVGLGPSHTVLDGYPAPVPNGKGHSSPTFRPVSIVAKRSPISATAELLLSASVCVLPITSMERGKFACTHAVAYIVDA